MLEASVGLSSNILLTPSERIQMPEIYISIGKRHNRPTLPKTFRKNVFPVWGRTFSDEKSKFQSGDGFFQMRNSNSRVGPDFFTTDGHR
ncbi:MAG: hypothetical protein JWM68_4001 [Verrucomicrobiales bacterium]|nr:hypothetical protein [Verrucomicrobiales bacterium]